MGQRSIFDRLKAKCAYWAYRFWYQNRFGAQKLFTSEEVLQHKDLSYAVSESEVAKLDVYEPCEVGSKLPVILYIPGGGWILDNRHDPPTNVQRNLCAMLAAQNFVVVSASHRLSPQVHFPTHIEDIALALQWIYKHIAQYKGDPQNLFIVGYSSGAQVGSMLSLQEKYLKQAGFEKRPPIKGIVGICGVYNIGHFAQDLLCRELMVEPAFGKDEKVWQEASPSSFTQGTKQPFCLITAEDDVANLREEAFELRDLLLKNGNRQVEMHIIPNTSHFTVLVSNSNNPLLQIVKNFINKHI